MRLLIVTQTLDSDDPILGFFHRWVEEFAKHVEKVTVVALSVGKHDLPKNVSVHSLGKELGLERSSRIMRFVSLIIKLRYEYDTVFAHMNPEYVIAGGPFWRLFGKKVGFWYVHSAVGRRLKLALFLSHVVFTASKESLRLTHPKVKIVGHGIDTEVFVPAKVFGDGIISVGRFSPSKNLEVIIDAMKILKSRGIHSPMVIMGAPGTKKEKEYAERIVTRAKSAEVLVDAAMPNRSLPTPLQKRMIFLNASSTGSMDKAVLEAASVGLIPISSNVAFKDMLEPLGLYVEKGTPDAFANKVEEVLKLGDKLTLSGKLREEVIEKYSLTKLIPKLVGLLH